LGTLTLDPRKETRERNEMGRNGKREKEEGRKGGRHEQKGRERLCFLLFDEILATSLATSVL